MRHPQTPCRSIQLWPSRPHDDYIAEHQTQEIAIAQYIGQLFGRIATECMNHQVGATVNERMHDLHGLVQKPILAGKIRRVGSCKLSVGTGSVNDLIQLSLVPIYTQAALIDVSK